jgi:hypothetical protein
MGTCPDEECKTNLKEKITGHHMTLYGADGTGGLSALPEKIDTILKTKVSNVKFYVAIGTVVVVLVGGFFSIMQPIWDRKERIDMKQFDKLANCDILTAKMQTTVFGIEEDLREIKLAQKEMSRKQITKDDLREMLKEHLR